MKRIDSFLLSLLLLPSALLAGWTTELVWPMGTYSPTGNFFDDIGTGFGPMNSGGEWFNPGVDINLTGSVKVAYPADPDNSNTHVARVKNLRVHADSGWVLLEAIRPDHEARMILYYFVTVNGSDIHIGDTFAGGVTLTGVTVTSPRHLRFSVFGERVASADAKLYHSTVNPYSFLPYPTAECANNVYTPSLSSDGSGSYFQLEVQQTRKCRVLDQIQLNFISDVMAGDRIIGLNDRKSQLLRDLSTSSGNAPGTTWSAYENVYYNGVKIDADAASGNMTTTRYRIYYTAAPSNSGKYAFTLKDTHGRIFQWKAKTDASGCSPCYPNAPQSVGGTGIPYSSGRPGIDFSWKRISGADAYIVYRADGIGGPGNVIRTGDQIGFFLDSAVSNGPDTMMRRDPVMTSATLYSRPGAQVAYSVSTVDGNSAGCIGPFITITPTMSFFNNCSPSGGTSCFDHCLSADNLVNMPQAAMPTGGLEILYQGTKVFALKSDGVMGLKGRRLSVDAGGFLFKKDTTTILNIKNQSLTLGGVTYVGAGFGMKADQVYSAIPLEGLKFQSSDRSFYLTDYGKLGFDSQGPLQEIYQLNTAE